MSTKKIKRTIKKSALKAKRLAVRKVNNKHFKAVSKSRKVKVVAKKVLKVKLSAKAKLEKIRLSSEKRAANAKSKKLIAQKNEEQARNDRHLEEVKRVKSLVDNTEFVGSVTAEVGGGAIDVLKTLVEGPKTDDSIAEKLSIKVNDVRRMLNVMNSYSIVRYDVNKDNKGWLIFTWRIDSEKLNEYVAGVSKKGMAVETYLPGNCNDFFVCKNCYSKEKTVLPFDSAFEVDFSCGSCGKPFALLSREETVALFKTVEA